MENSLMFMQHYLICYFACCNIHYVLFFLILFCWKSSQILYWNWLRRKYHEIQEELHQRPSYNSNQLFMGINSSLTHLFSFASIRALTVAISQKRKKMHLQMHPSEYPVSLITWKASKAFKQPGLTKNQSGWKGFVLIIVRNPASYG